MKSLTFNKYRYTTLRDASRAIDMGRLEDVSELQSGQFQGVAHRLALDTNRLVERICPLQLRSGLGLAIVLSEFARDDDVLAVLIAMQQAGLKLASPPLIAVNATQFSVIARIARPDLKGRPSGLSQPVRAATPGHVLFCVFDDMLTWALQHGASDLHFSVFSGQTWASVAFSVRGRLVRPAEFAQISKELMQELLSVLWMSIEGGSGAVFEPELEQQGRFERTINGQTLRLRWASVSSHQGPSVTLRILNRDRTLVHAQMAQLGYESDQLPCFERARLATGGAVLFAGAVGSGKSTALASLICGLPSDRKVMTLEDPVELEIPNAIQCAITVFGHEMKSVNRFDIKLQAIKRSAANDVLIGEIRDAGSARALGDLLVAGVSVYSTIHAGSVVQIIHRLCSPLLGLSVDLLSVPGTLKLLVYQALLNRLCASCSFTTDQWLTQTPRYSALGQPMSLPQAQNWLQQSTQSWPNIHSQARFRNLQGCPACKLSADERSEPDPFRQGYSGFLMAAEMLEPMRIADFDRWLLQQTGSASGMTAFQAETMRFLKSHGFLSARERAFRFMTNGWLDPLEFESRFG